MTECNTCKDWSGCSGKDFYKPSDIRYCGVQVVWLLQNPCLDEGRWPNEHRETGYIGNSKSNHHSAYFEVTMCVIGELNKRISRCGNDGIIFRQMYSSGIEQVGDMVRLHPHLAKNGTIEQIAGQVMSYVTGYRRKRISYKRFLWEKNNRGKVK